MSVFLPRELREREVKAKRVHIYCFTWKFTDAQMSRNRALRAASAVDDNKYEKYAIFERAN